MYKNFLALILVVVCSSVAFAGKRRPLFTDNSFARLLALSQAYQTQGVIYTWSPRMNLSLLGIAELQTICKELKLNLIILLDPNISDEEANRVQKPFDESSLPSFRLYSQRLVEMGVLIHYPCIIIYKNGKIIGAFRPGYDEPGRAHDYLLRSLQ